MRRSADFTSAVRRGRRIRRGSVVVHCCAADPDTDPTPTLVGFVVAKAVGGSVVRHQVSRRLRAVVASRLSALPAGSAIVVRALPGAADASSREMAADLDVAFERLAGLPR